MFDDRDDAEELDLIEDDLTKLEDEEEEIKLQMRCKKPTLANVREFSLLMLYGVVGD